MPGKGRESYELQYGARARQALNQAVQSGNPAGTGRGFPPILPHRGRIPGHAAAGTSTTWIGASAGRRIDPQKAARFLPQCRSLRAGVVARCGQRLAPGGHAGKGAARHWPICEQRRGAQRRRHRRAEVPLFDAKTDPVIVVAWNGWARRGRSLDPETTIGRCSAAILPAICPPRPARRC